MLNKDKFDRFVGKRGLAWLLLTASSFAAIPAFAQLDNTCTVSVLNRTVQVGPDGSWVLPGVPANLGQVRARATCVRNGTTTAGQSDFFTPQPNGVVNSVKITFGAVTPVPGVLRVSTPSNTLSSIGATTQLTVISTVADGTTANLSTSQSGTNYTTSNPAVATVSLDGLVTAVSSGTTIISTMNEGALGVIAINVVLGGSSHGGIPDSWAIAHGLDPNDPAMPFEDPDHDGLTNLQEFQHGTDPHNPDTDGDGIPDGLEVAEGTDPLNPNSFNLTKALKSIQVTPPTFTINFNTLLGEGSRQLIVTGTLNDMNATQIDLTSTRRGTNYASSDLTVCNFGALDGQVFAGNTGTCTITVSNSGFTAQATGIIKTFVPTPLSFIAIPGFANNVKVNGNFTYVAAGSAGLQVVDVTDRTNPKIVSSLATPGNANDLRVVGNKVYLAAGAAGLLIIDVTNPLAPSLLGSVKTPDIAWDVAVSGNLAFIGAGAFGLQIADVSNPTAPTIISSTSPTTSCPMGTAKGIAVSGNFALVAAGSGGLQVVDISNPANPQILGCVGMPSGDARKVQAKGTTAFVAPYPDSLQVVDFSTPSSPQIVGTTSFTLGGRLQDVAVTTALGETLTLGADVFFVNGVPITDVTVPSNPISRAIIDFRRFRDDNGHGIAVDSAFVYMTGEEGSISDIGVSGDTRLYIGQYLALEDTAGIPPTALISSPTAGTTVIERQTIPVTVLATDDVAVASVSLTVNGQVVDTQTAPPYQFSFQVPVGVSTVTLGAFAVDLGSNIGKALPVQLKVIPDPGTTAVGKVIDIGGNPVAGATVTTFGGRSSTTGSDGSYSITQVPTVLGNIAVTATFTQPDGSILKGVSAAAPPVPLGITQIGTITVVPVPVITFMSRKSALAGTTVTFHITGTTLTGSKFLFSPASSPSIPVPSSSIDPTGTSATLTVSVPARVFGTFALVATNIAGNSNTTITPINRFTTVDPSSRADTDGDGFPDVVEAFFGTDPLDPNSIPAIPSLLGEAEGTFFTVLNGNAQPPKGTTFEAESPAFSLVNGSVSVIPGPKTFELESPAFTVLNSSQVGSAVHEAESPSFTVLNSGQTGGVTLEANSPMFSLVNNSPSVTPGKNNFEAESPMFSINNAIAGRNEAESLPFSVLNQSLPTTPVFHEADSLPFSVRNTVPPPPNIINTFEAASPAFTVLNGSQPTTLLIRELDSPAFSVLNSPASSAPSSFEVESPSFTILNSAQPSGGNVFETSSPLFAVLNSTAGVGTSTFEAESLVFSTRNTIPPPPPGTRFEAESLPFTLLNSSQPGTITTHELESSAFSILNNNAPVPPTNSFETESSAFVVFNGNQSATPVTREAESPAFSVVNSSTSTLPGQTFEANSPAFTLLNGGLAVVSHEAESQMFSLVNNSASITPGPNRLEAESLMFSINNAIPGLEAESLAFTVLNTSQLAVPVFHESDSLPFSLRNTVQPPPQVVGRFETESANFTLLNGSQPMPRGSREADSLLFSILNTQSDHSSSFEAASPLFTLLNASQPSVRRLVESDSPSFSLLNTSTGPGTGPIAFEAESQVFSIRNTAHPVPGLNSFEADSMSFTLLNGSQPATPVLREAESLAFSLLNNGQAGVNNFEASSPLFSILNSGSNLGPVNLEANSGLFSLLNGVLPSGTFEAESPYFSLRNTAVARANQPQTVVAARSKRRNKPLRTMGAPHRQTVPGAALRSTSSGAPTKVSQTSTGGQRKPSTTPVSETNFGAANSTPDKSSSQIQMNKE